MLLIDNVSTFADGSVVAIPDYHRGHLSLKHGTEVTVCLLNPVTVVGPATAMCEMVISPIAFESWQFLTRVTAMFLDRRGVVRKLATALRMQGIDLMYAESASVQNGQYHRVEMLVDASSIYPRQPGLMGKDVDLTVLSGLERRLKAICMHELALDGRRLRLKVRPMEGLRNAWVAYETGQRVRVNGSDRPPRIRTEKPGLLRIPVELLQAAGQTQPFRGVLVSDTKDRLLRILMPHAAVHFTYIHVAHNDVVGAFARITDCLSTAFNAVLTLCRLKRQGNRNDVELLLYSERHPGEQDDATRRQIAEGLLAAPGLADLQIGVAYPKEAGQTPERTWPPTPMPSGVSVTATDDLVNLEDALGKKSTGAILQQRIQEFGAVIARSPDLRETRGVRDRLDAARYLLVQEVREQPLGLHVFTSLDFTQRDLYHDVVAPLLKENEAMPLDGSDLQGKQLRSQLLQRITEAVGFIGVWKERPDEKNPGKTIFSDWLLWELGVAEARGIPVLLFVHDNVAKHHYAYYPNHCVPFKDHTLHENLTNCLPDFISKVREFSARTAVERYRSGTLEELT